MTTTASPLLNQRLVRLDFLGSALSTLCAIHCLAMPLVVGLLPLLGLGFIGSRGFERGACLAMMALAALCLYQGCRRHRRWWLLGLLGVGAALTLGTQFLFAAEACAKTCCAERINWSEALVMFAGGSAIATAHLLNLRFCRACACCTSGTIPLVAPGGVGAMTSSETPGRRTALSVLLAMFATSQALAAHSDIILSRSNGMLRVDATIHTSDLRENDAAGNGTVWATDNPGFAGSGFVFQDEFLFDITGPLRRWDGTNWAAANVGPEFMEFVEPGPFGDPIHSVTITRGTSFATGYQITEAGTRGSLHTHFAFILRATNGVAPAVGAYSFPITLRSPQYASAPPVHLVFNNGLAETIFDNSVNQFRDAQDMRLTLARGTNGALALSLFTVEGRTNQMLSAPTATGPWSNEGAPFIGTGGWREIAMPENLPAKFLRIRSE